MKVEILRNFHDNDKVFAMGEITEVPDEKGKMYVGNRWAKVAPEIPIVEHAVPTEKVETAAVDTEPKKAGRPKK